MGGEGEGVEEEREKVSLPNINTAYFSTAGGIITVISLASIH